VWREAVVSSEHAALRVAKARLQAITDIATVSAVCAWCAAALQGLSWTCSLRGWVAMLIEPVRAAGHYNSSISGHTSTGGQLLPCMIRCMHAMHATTSTRRYAQLTAALMHPVNRCSSLECLQADRNGNTVNSISGCRTCAVACDAAQRCASLAGTLLIRASQLVLSRT
jgi:hypothetical protein